MERNLAERSKAAFGVGGLDDITDGGLTRGRLYLLEGSPGTGKTTIAMQFLMDGAAKGERALYITLSETDDELRSSAASHGWSLDGIDVFELVPPESLLDDNQQQSLLYSSDLELGETTKRIFEAFERIKPSRVVLDSLSEIRLLAQSSLRYRRQILTLSFIKSAVMRGENAAMFAFDEELGLLFERSKGLGIDLSAMVDTGNLVIEQIDAAELTPGEFSERVRRCVEKHGARTVVIDSLNGYQAAMPEEQALILHMHELLQYLNRHGVTTFLTVARHGLVGDMKSPVDVTYLADTVILLRYFEALGRARRAISVVKKRTGAHEDTSREFMIGSNGITLGEPLTGFQGVLRGVPNLVGEGHAELLDMKKA